jgi:prophage regulatory protein
MAGRYRNSWPDKPKYARSTIYQYISSSDFPKQIKLGCKFVALLESDIDTWLKTKTDESRD